MARRPVDLAAAALQLFQAQLEADGQTLVKMALPEEVAANSLTARKAQRLYQELILPRLGVGTTLKPSRVTANASKGSAAAVVRTTGGGSVELEADVYLVDEGIGSPITQRLFVAWQKAYYEEHKPVDPILDRIEAVVAGFEKDRATLEDIGIRALCDIDYAAGKVKLIPLDSLEQQYATWRTSILESRKVKAPAK